MNIPSIKRERNYAETNISVVGITTEYDRPQFVLVSSSSNKIRFPGSSFRPPNIGKTLEDVAIDMFYEQTGLEIKKSLGLRTIVTGRSYRRKQWMFRNVFFVVLDQIRSKWKRPNEDIVVYLADSGQGIASEPYVFSIGEAKDKRTYEWRTPDNHTIARIANEVLNHFNWKELTTDWYSRIPLVKNEVPYVSKTQGCGIGVASMIVFYKPSETEEEQVILAKRKGDDKPGYAGGKIETPESNQENTTPISCCAQEGYEEFGFRIEPRSLNCVACTPLHVPGNPRTSDEFYNSLITYNFVAEPANTSTVIKALNNPNLYLKDPKIESYHCETVDQHRDRIRNRELRMPDMGPCGEQFFLTTPSQKIPLTCFRNSGTYK